jgi:TPP-dependent pyruvate/acetoin dehydrogenase alpha subunit
MQSDTGDWKVRIASRNISAIQRLRFLRVLRACNFLQGLDLLSEVLMTTFSNTCLNQRTQLMRTMMVIRKFEERCEAAFREARVRGAMHLAIGQEAVAVGACSALESRDPICFTYRSHAWAIARGIPPVEVFAECFGRDSGCSRGRGGSKHLSDWSRRRMLPSNAIVGAGLPLANGLALAAKYRSTSDVTLGVFGDGAINEGGFYEGLSQAVVWNLPVVFLCENNQYAELTLGRDMRPVFDLKQIAAGVGVPTIACDGMDVDAVSEAVGVAANRARSGRGPTFVEATTYRFCGHMTGDPELYRSKDELQKWRLRDPLVVFGDRLQAEGASERELIDLSLEVEATVSHAEATAWSSPEPNADDILLGAPSWTRLER